MKKFFFFATALMMSGMLMAQDMELKVSDLDPANTETTKSWGNATVNGNVITFAEAWNSGIGWNFSGGMPLTAYRRIVLTFEPFEGKVQLNVNYDADGQDIAKNSSTEGTGIVALDLDPEKSAHVYAIYMNASKMGNVTVLSCVLEGGADPYDITGKFEIPLVQEVGDNCIFVMKDELEAHDPADVVVCTVNCINPSKLITYGIAKIIAMADWENPQFEMLNKVDGVGQSEYRFLISELIQYGKKYGSDWYVSTDTNHPGSGVTFNSYQGDSEFVGELKCYSNNSTAVEKVAVKEAKAQKVVENGVLYILKNGVKYNALGAAAR